MEKTDYSPNYRIIGKLDHVIKSFGEVVAISDASFSIERGQIIGFLGPNGSGKTTSIELLLGLIKPQEGKVTLFGIDPFYNSRIKRLISYISEEGQCPYWMNAFEYVNSFARLTLTREEAINRTNQTLEEVGLENVANKKVRQFSKGMKQRVKIAAALATNPILLIGDEPFNGLDPVARNQMFELFKSYQEDLGITFFISSHILFEVEKLANEIILLYKGRTIAQGTPRRIREMIQNQPHSIKITTNQPKQVIKQLIEHSDENLVSSFRFEKDDGQLNLLIDTLEPRQFYNLFTQLVVDYKLPVTGIKATDEGLESLFRSLTVG